MIEEAFTCHAVLGLDVGKFSHWACLVTRAGEIALNRPVANAEEELDALFSQVADGTLVVVDQCRNIGSLAIRRARLAGLGVPTCPASPPTVRQGCSPAAPRPTSATPS